MSPNWLTHCWVPEELNFAQATGDHLDESEKIDDLLDVNIKQENLIEETYEEEDEIHPSPSAPPPILPSAPLLKRRSHAKTDDKNEGIKD